MYPLYWTMKSSVRRVILCIIVMMEMKIKRLLLVVKLKKLSLTIAYQLEYQGKMVTMVKYKRCINANLKLSH